MPCKLHLYSGWHLAKCIAPTHNLEHQFQKRRLSPFCKCLLQEAQKRVCVQHTFNFPRSIRGLPMTNWSQSNLPQFMQVCTQCSNTLRVIAWTHPHLKCHLRQRGRLTWWRIPWTMYTAKCNSHLSWEVCTYLSQYAWNVHVPLHCDMPEKQRGHYGSNVLKIDKAWFYNELLHSLVISFKLPYFTID